MSTALIKPKIVKWAIQRSQIDIDQLAHKIPVKTERISEWEEGVSHPTFLQAQKLANILHIPFGYLFLENPPSDNVTVPDLRTIGDIRSPGFSPDLKDVITDVLRKQAWYREILIEDGQSRIPFLNKYSLETDNTIIADDISRILGLSIDQREQVRNWEEFLRLLMDRAEEAGIWVMRNGRVGYNSHRILDVEEFRGFTVCDEYAPVVFLNGTDATAAQIFTLIHELAHIWLGQSGVSNLSVDARLSFEANRTEKKCNQIAAEVLVPGTLLKERWEMDQDLEWNTLSLSRYFRVSPVVIARRALDLSYISQKEFQKYYLTQVKIWKQIKTEKPPGGSFYTALPIANGKNFTETVLQSVYSQRILMRDGARLLGTNIGSLEELAARKGFH